MLYDFTKRVLDIFGASLGLIILSPLFLIIAVLIKLDSSGPILAKTPRRVGQQSKLFRIYKFRSMVKHAHEILRKTPNLLREYKKHGYKIFQDPRVTTVGKFLRRFSLDELPQLLNILKGEMSLVGPRAYYPFELKEQQRNYPKSRKYVKIILSGKPGVTGVWQVSGRSEIKFDKRVRMDAGYIKRRSILYDLWIMLKTIPAVLSGRGAV